MTLKALVRPTLVVLAVALIFAATRVTTHHPSHPYQAPDFTLQDLSGAPIRLSDLRGKAVVLNFWATWCPPCRTEIPWFVAMQKKYGSKGLQVIGVSMDDGGKNAVQPFVSRMGIDYPVLLGNDHVASLYGGVEVLPTTYYINRNGTVSASVTGLISPDQVERNIEDALRQSPTPSTLSGLHEVMSRR